jgi:hypothetical protein
MHRPVRLRYGQVLRRGDTRRNGSLQLLVKTNFGSVGGGHPGDDSQALALSIWRVFHVKSQGLLGVVVRSIANMVLSVQCGM